MGGCLKHGRAKQGEEILDCLESNCSIEDSWREVSVCGMGMGMGMGFEKRGEQEVDFSYQIWQEVGDMWKWKKRKKEQDFILCQDQLIGGLAICLSRIQSWNTHTHIELSCRGQIWDLVQ